MKSQKYYRVML